jgi:prepilin-type N-terminal cleavage/methylation domain-containing protein
MQLTTNPNRPSIRRRLRADDQGMTLIELLMVIVILGIIVVPLGDAMIMFFRQTGNTTHRLSESHDAQIADAYFAQDVASIGRHDWTAAPFPLAQSIEVNVGATQGLDPCGTAATPAAVVRLLWDDPSAAQTPAVYRVSYVVETVGGEQQLHRIECRGSSTAYSDLVLAHNLVSASVSCSTTCTSATVPQTVTLTLQIRASGTTDPILTVTLTGQRRQT